MQLQHLVIDENGMAFDPTVGTSYQLGGSAQEIIDLLKEGKTKNEIVETLAQRHGADRSEIYIDVSDFLAKLRIYGLIR
ncbi:PqqD family protein [Nitratifractor salsuginis]|uniref:Coenzyme PQQ synthesis D n=1 Tax=Nitratifractor salsuginis (strain DSM 16511 / JCM 12458 / E9I37-1) TaxID=749222 RepID=E6X060_NITSE|nr:PqqD family protein [Nitratifractor salsuginis]ADV46783.1 hypothetical protein Nitsa_1535 [Nitratifractor salsuginis DSM 16511]